MTWKVVLRGNRSVETGGSAVACILGELESEFTREQAEAVAAFLNRRFLVNDYATAERVQN